MNFGPQSKRVLSAALLGIVSCTGEIGESLSRPRSGPSIEVSTRDPRPPRGVIPPGADPPPVDVDTCPSLTRQRARRLSLREYEQAVADVIELSMDVSSAFAPDPSVHGFDNQADALSISSGNFEEFATAAQLAAEAANVASLAPCSADVAPDACAASFVATVGDKAYGRALTTLEQRELLGLYAEGAALEGYERGIRTVIETVLISPHFLYRSEVGNSRAAVARLDADEVANAVAFALTGQRPDAELLARAATDPLFRTPDVLREEATRIAGTAESRKHMARFLRGWLGVPNMNAVNKIPAMFPHFNPALKRDLDIEIDRFLDHVLTEQHGTLEALIGSPVTFVNASVFNAVYANDYAPPLTVPEVPTSGVFVPLEFNPDLRKGVLSLGGWLAAHAPVHRSSPVDRGLAIRNRFFCTSLAPPPPGALSTTPGPGDSMGTTRQKFEEHTKQEVCRSCHKMMDPIGFGFEMMDALGSYRETEAGLPVDSRGELTGTDVDGPFRGPAELADRLLASRQVRDCFVIQMYRYIEGRDEVEKDSCEISVLQQYFATPETSIGELAAEIVAQPRFMQRSVEP